MALVNSVSLLALRDSEVSITISRLLFLAMEWILMAYSHCMGPGTTGPNILYRNVHTGPRPGKEPRPIASFCAGPVPCICPGPILLQCEQAISIGTFFLCVPEAVSLDSCRVIL